MAEKINIDIIINAAQSAKTLKEQKDALNQINKALDEVKQGSGAFELLSDSANELKASMDTLTLSFEDVYGSGTKPLTAQMGELEDRMYAMAIAGQQNTQEFKTLQQEAIKMRKTIIDVDESVDSFAQKGARLQGFIGVVQGIAGGFAVASSASKLFAGENERLQQSIEKTALVLELLSGLEAINTSLKQKNVIISGIQNGIRKATIALVGQEAVAQASNAAATGTATIAQRALNAAMSANPIGLLIVGIGTLIGLYSAFSGKSKELTKEEKRRKDEIIAIDKAQKEQVKTIAEESSKFVELIYQLKETNKGSKERNNLIKEINKEYGTTLKNLSDETQFQKLLNKEVEDYISYQEVKLRIQKNEQAFNQVLQEKLTLETKIANAQSEAQKVAKSLNITVGDYYRNNSEVVKSLEQWNSELSIVDSKLTKYTKRIVTLKDNQNELTDSGKKYITTNKDITKSVDDVSESEEELTKKIQEQIDILQKAEVESSNYLMNYRKNALRIELETLNNNYREQISLLINSAMEAEKLENERFNSKDAKYKKDAKNIKAHNDKLSEIDKELNDSLLLNNKEYITRAIELNSKLNSENLDRNIELNQLQFENTINSLNQLEELEKSQIKKSNLSEKQKNKELKDIETNYFNQRKIESEKYFKKQEQRLAISLKNQNNLLDEQIKTEQDNVNESIQLQQDYIDAIKVLNESLSTETNENEKKDIEQTIKDYKVKLTLETKYGQSSLNILTNLQIQKADNEAKYNDDIQKLASETTDKLGKEEENRTQKTKEETEKRINDTIDFVTQSLDSSLNLLSAIFNQISEQRISNIEREKDAALQAIQDEEDAYIDSTEKKTNAEKFKEDKQNEFARKREEINAKYDRERNEAEYKNQVIQWEFAYGQAVVNLAGALIKSAPNPFLLATTGVLGTIQLATMLANRPVKRFAKGGLLEGKSHAEGGISTPFGEMEGGEAVINKKSTKQYLPILSAINEAGGGVPLVNMPKMASGGLTTINNMVDTSNIEMILEKYFDRPIKTYVTTSDISNAQSIDNRLTSRTTF